MATVSQHSASGFSIELAGAFAGRADAVSGGEAVGDVVADRAGADGVVHKHLANVEYEDLVLTVGAGLSDAFYDWISSVFETKGDVRAGVVSLQDYTGAEKQRLSWLDGQISQVVFPALDAGSPESVHLTVSVKPQGSRWEAGTGTPAAASAKLVGWKASNFRLLIDGIDCTGVRTIDAIAVTRREAAAAGVVREAKPAVVSVDIPNLTIVASSARAGDLLAWHEDFVVNGNHLEKDERTGTLEFLAPNMHDVLLTLKLRGLGIFRIARGTDSTAGSGTTTSVEAGIYCEQISLEYPKAPAAPAAPAAPVRARLDPSSLALSTALRDALLGLLGPTDPPAPDQVAARLLATAGADGPTTTAASAAERGRQIGADWARNHATLEELRSLTTTRDGDWTGVELGDGHSLVTSLQQEAVVDESHDGPLILTRDPFVEGLVGGAAEVFDEVQPHLGATPV